MKASEYSYMSGVERLKQQENDLSLAIANAYIGVIFSEEVLKISKNQYQITKEQLERTQKLVTAGALAKSVEYDILSQLANEEVNVTTAENNVDLTMLNLKQLMNFDSVTNFTIARPELNIQENTILENNVNNVYETALKNQPSIISSEYAILSSQLFMKASKGRYSPTLSLNANMGTGTSGLAQKQIGSFVAPSTVSTSLGNFDIYQEYPLLEKKPFANQFKDNINKSLGFSLNIPIFNGLQTQTAYKNAKLNAMNAKYTLDIAKQNLYKNIAQAKANAKAALNKFKSTQSSVKAANESFFYAQQKMNAGTISAFEFNSSKNRVFAAESNMLQAKFDYIFKLKVIDYYMGKPIGL
jgi:outer membrane protein